MFKRAHIMFTLLCTGITTFIMIIMSLSYLYVSEQGLKRNQLLSFQNDVTNLLSNLEQNNIVTFQWLSQMESINQYIVHLTDNGIPLLFNKLSLSGNASDREILVSEAVDSYQSSNLREVSEDIDNRTEFMFYSPSTNSEYYGCIAELRRETGTLQVIIISSLHTLQSQIFDQRIIFVMINAASLLLLSTFSWFFTWKLLHPIKENQKRQTEFVAATSHELRTPLASILSCAESCENATSEEQYGFIKSIRFEALRMSGLIEDMLTLSQADQYHFTIRKTETELDTLLLNFFESFDPMAKEKNILLSISLPEVPLPRCKCDKDRIGQVISALIHNAISYTQENGEIKISLNKSKNSFLIAISDNGPGIPTSEKEKIFERFYRSETSRSTRGHYGLGLCIALEMINAHSGTIKVTDTAGGGSTFTVYLPAE